MENIHNITFQVCGLVPLLLIVFFIFIRYRRGLKLKASYIYEQLLVTTTLCVSIDLLSVLSVGNVPWIIQVGLCRLYLFFVVMTAYMSVYYIWIHIPKFGSLKKLRQTVSVIVCLLAFVSAFILPIKMNVSHNYFYTSGLAVSVTFGLCGDFILIFIILISVFKGHLNRERHRAAMVWIGIEAVAALIQLYIPSLLVVSYAMAVGIMILSMKIENPDQWIDRNTGAYTLQMFKEYLGELYSDGKTCSCVILSERPADKSVIYEEKNVIRLVDRLASFCGGRVFCGIGSSFIMTFETEEEARQTIKRMNRYLEAAPDKLKRGDVYIIPDISIVDDVEELILIYQHISTDDKVEKNGLTVIDSDVLDNMINFQSIRKAVKEALEDDRIEVFYQPIYSTAEKRFVSAEALVRMRDKDGSLVPPGIFIPVAESTGLIGQIGDRVFEKVCDIIKEGRLRELGIRYIEVNLSIMQCEDKTLAGRYSQMITSYEIEPSAINLEITETGQMQDRLTLMENLEMLRGFGCSFSLDDFGTGESNLNYIVEMPVEIVKFDRTMLLSYFKNDKTKLMMKYVVKMIKQMGMKIVAEGVEEEYQLKEFEELGVDYIQGFYFSKPIPKEEFILFLENSLDKN